MNLLQKPGRSLKAVAVLLLGTLSASANAEMITEKLFESTTLVTGTNMNVAELNLTTPGTLVIELKDLQWPALLDVLSFCLTDTRSVLQKFSVSPTSANNTWTFVIAEPNTLYASIFAKPSANAKAGMYYANISYQSMAPVPLPAAAWFLISGIAGLAAFRPKQKLSQI